MRRTGLAIALALGLGGQAAADQGVVFDVSSGLFSLGALQLSAEESGSTYTARLRMKGGGLAGALVKFAFDGAAKGQVNGERMPVSQAYDGTRELRDDARRTRMSFKGGRVTARNLDPDKPSRPYDVDISGLRGVMDPVSAAYTLLVDQPVGKACGRRLDVFDGSRLFRISVGARQQNGEGWRCSGEYLRVAGYSPKQMQKKRRYAFTLYYTEQGGMMRLQEFRTDSIVGDAVAKRR